MDLIASSAPGGDAADSGQKDSEPETTRTKKPVVRHSTAAKMVLKKWLVAHPTRPYPDSREKQSLSEQSGMSVQQVSQWFANARRRGGSRSRDKAGSGDEMHEMHEVVHEMMPGSARLHSFGEMPDLSNMRPLERWRHSPPEDEPVAWDTIRQALGQQQQQRHHMASSSVPDLRSVDPTASPGWLAYSDKAPSSVSSRGGVSSSSQSSGSAAVLSHRSSSVESGGPPAAGAGDDLRRRRRRRRVAVAARGRTKGRADDKDKRIYQCTFCTDAFKFKYDWTRHEATLHLTLEKWTCLPNGPCYVSPEDGRRRCALCDTVDPSEAHIASHHCADCVAKPLRARTFYRKDHFRQHLRLSHGVGQVLRSMDGWRSKVLRVKSRCGFCGETFTMWTDRNDHLAEHFRAGHRIEEWKGCRGLEASVSLLVENAMPPYLIGIESRNLEPFSATRGSASPQPDGGGGADADEGTMAGTMARRSGPTIFENLTIRLSDFVNRLKREGTPVTDDMLKREARTILYGDDDPWNQTPADSAEWLSLFKEGHRIGVGETAAAAPSHSGDNEANSTDDTQARLAKATNAFCSYEGSYEPPNVLVDSGLLTPATLERLIHATSQDTCGIPLDLVWLPVLQQQEERQEERQEEERQQQQSAVANNSHPSTAANFTLPLCWQAPECLAEFHQMTTSAPPSALPMLSGSSGNSGDNGNSTAVAGGIGSLDACLASQTPDLGANPYQHYPTFYGGTVQTDPSHAAGHATAEATLADIFPFDFGSGLDSDWATGQGQGSQGGFQGI